MEERSGGTKIKKKKKEGETKKNADNKTSISELVACRKTILRGRVRP